MWRGAPIPIALTIDDAPSVCEPDGPALDPRRMDRVRELLLESGVRSCVAFVIGERARGHEDSLRRWLDAGFELGNHTHDHAAASAVEPGRFIESVRQCHQLLVDVEAFAAGRRCYFRHPFGDRGPAGATRRTIAAGIADLGYSVAEPTVDLYDYAYDPPWERSEAGRLSRGAQIEARWINAAAGSIERSEIRGRRLWGPDFVHVAVCHFGPVTVRALPALLWRIATQVRWVALSEASDVPRYRRLIADLDRDGTPSQLPAPGLADRVLRRAARVARQLGAFDESALGPRWPHLTR